jgi:membrane-associated phospholipid phosphatase
MSINEFNLKNLSARKFFNNNFNMNFSSDFFNVKNYRGLNTKGFNHVKSTGSSVVDEVEQKQYCEFIQAISSGNFEEIKRIIYLYNKLLVDPYNVIDLELNNFYKGNYCIEDYPSVESCISADEMVELYEMAILRDVPFSDWSTSSEVQTAINNLNLLTCFCAPKVNSMITYYTLFRGPTVGDLSGPYVSQFLYQTTNLGSYNYIQKYNYTNTNNYLTNITDFLNNWNGNLNTNSLPVLGQRYLSNLRDCTTYIQKDPPWQPFLIAWSLIQKLKVPYSFQTERKGNTFVSLGPIDIEDLIMRSIKIAMDVAWLTKYFKLRLRPEEFGYYVQLSKTGNERINIDSELLNNPVLNQIFSIYGNYLLPQAYPEGAPIHSSYPSGHATIAGAATTILKAFYNCNFEFPQSYDASSDGSSLIPNGYKLTIGNELDKLASNCAIFRNAAGIHYRSDLEGITIGENVAINVLTEFVNRYQSPIILTVPLRNGCSITISNF